MIYQFVREDMDVNENERLSNLTLKTQIKIKKTQCYSAVTVGSSVLIITRTLK